jgi:predicted Zn-dependent peptidase
MSARSCGLALGFVAVTSALAASSACAPAKEAAVEPVSIATPRPPTSASAPEPEPHYRETADEPFRAQAPDLAAAAFTPPLVRELHLKNGLRVLVLPRTSSIMRADFVVRTGDLGAPLGASTLVADCLRGGTTKRNEQQFGDDVDKELAQYSAWADAAAINVSLTARTDDVDTVLELLSDATLHATLPAQFVERDRDWYADQRQREYDVAKTTAYRVLPMALTGATRPLDVRTMLRATDFREIDREAVARAYEAAFVPSRSTLIVVGTVNETSLTAKLERHFGTFPVPKAHAAASAKPPPAKKAAPKPSGVATTSPPPSGARIVVVDRPESQQSYVLFGGLGPAPNGPSFLHAAMLEAIIEDPGGRVMRSIRDEQSLTARSTVNLDGLTRDTLFTWGAEVPLRRTADALREIDKQLSRFRNEDAAAREIDDSRQRALRSLPAAFVATETITPLLQRIAVYSLPADEVSTLAAREGAITAADVKRVAADMFDPARMKVVVVGDYSMIRQQLADLGWGAIEVRDVVGAVQRVDRP